MAKPVENQLQFIMVNMGFRRGLARAVLCLAATCSLFAQIIEFESGGLKYQTLTKSGVTVMVASLPAHVRDYAILQVAVSNGSPITWTVKPQDFVFHRADGQIIPAAPS